jgi:beta-lactamase class C
MHIFPAHKSWCTRSLGPFVAITVFLALATPSALADPTAAAMAPTTTLGARPLPIDITQEALLASEMDRLSNGVIRTGYVPGLAWVMVSGGHIVDAKGYGVTDVNTRGPVTAETVFRIASLSKAFASALSSQLVDQGVLDWGDRVQDMVPALLLKDQDGAGKLRIDELLSHRVGLPYNTYDRQLESEEPYPMLVEKLGEISPMCAVGDCYAYQNVAFSLIGDVVFAATGDFFTHQVEKRLFHPLGMTSATYGREALFGSKSYALPHIGTRGTLQSVIPKETYYHVPPAAGVNASANDLGQWLLAQLGHRPDVLSPELVALLHAPQVATPGELYSSPWRRARLRTAAYALGWRVFDYAGHDMVFHAGAVQGYRAMLGVLPNEDFGIAIVWNGEAAIPAGLFPTLIDQRLGLPAQDWLELSKFNPRAKKAKARRR